MISIPTRNRHINISKSEWVAMNATHSRIDIIEALIHTIQEQFIVLPMRDISFEDATEDFRNLQSAPTHAGIAYTPWSPRYDYDPRWYRHDVVLSSNLVGNKSSDYFHQTNRWKCDSIGAPSAYRTWHTEKFLRTLLPALWSLKVEEVNTSTLRTIIGLRKYIASQFRPMAAKAFYDTVEAVDVLDLSAGWGDRFGGFMASSARSYTAFDPNRALCYGYAQQMVNFLPKDKQAKFFHVGSETLSLKKDSVDTVFTSPPYFNLERYSQDATQSYKKYKKLDQWLEGFLFPSLENAWTALKPNGILAMNISDVYTGHVVNNICDPMNTYLDTLPNSCYIGAIGYEMHKRPNSGALAGKTGKFAEPVWMWRKGNSQNPFERATLCE